MAECEFGERPLAAAAAVPAQDGAEVDDRSVTTVSDYVADRNEELTQALASAADSHSNGGQREPSKTRSSRFRGVCWNKKNRRWQSAINNSGRYIYLGSFVSDEDAARAFDLAALRIRGRNTKLNFSVSEYPKEDWENGPPAHLVEKYHGCPKPKPVQVAPCIAAPGAATGLIPENLQNFSLFQSPYKRDRLYGMIGGKDAYDRAEVQFLLDSSASSRHRTTGLAFHTVKTEPESPPKANVPAAWLDKPTLRTLEDSAKDLHRRPSANDRPQASQKSNPIYPNPKEEQRRKEDILNCSDRSTRTTFDFPSLQDVEDPLPERKRPRRDLSTVTRVEPRANRPRPEDRPLQVSSFNPEQVAGSVPGNGIEEAKLIVGSSRNHFGLIYRMMNMSKWSALVWDGDTMHPMGLYSSEQDSQVSCGAAVQLVEAMLNKDGSCGSCNSS